MMARVLKCWSLAILLGVLAGPAGAFPITVDGNPSDWGIAPGPYGASDWEPFAGVEGVWGRPEDSQPGTNGGFVNPGYGDQTFDAEAFYITYDPEYLYFAVVAGLPRGGASGHYPGDIAIDMGRDGTWDLGIETTGNNGNAVGALYAVARWGAGLWGSTDPTSILNGTAVWQPDFPNLFYSRIGTTDHYFIETAIPLDRLPISRTAPTPYRVHWTQTCGNDAVDAMAGFPPLPDDQQAIPEPATCALLGGGLLAVLARRFRVRGKEATGRS
jgi:hypothetical protein